MKRKEAIYAFIAVSMITILVGAGSAFGAMDLPDKLKDVPLFPGAKIQQVMDMENHSMATLAVKAKPEAIADFYKNNLKPKGWKVSFQAQQEDGQVLQFQKDSQVLHVNIEGAGETEDATYNLVLTSK